MSFDQFSHLTPEEQQVFLNGPALQPPSGVIPNFENPPNRVLTAYFGVSICLLFTLIAVFVRSYFKVIAIKRINIEDFLALCALGTYAGFIYGILHVAIGFKGYYIHQWDVRVRDMPIILRSALHDTVLYEATMMTIKVAILRDWARIFAPRGTRNTAFLWICYGMLCVNVVYYTTAILVSTFSCSPHEKIWDRLVPGRCIDAKVVLICSASINVVSDLLILILPQKIIWSLSISTKKKIGISFFFATGIHGCACAIVRLYLAVRYYRSQDSTYWLAGLSLWCLGEMTCAFVVFSAPATPRVFTGTGMKSTFTDILDSCSTMLTRPTRQSYVRSWPAARPASPNHRYQRVDENGTPLQALPPARVVSLQQTGAHTRNLSEVGILRTTHIETSVNYVNGERQGDIYSPPHEWNGNV